MAFSPSKPRGTYLLPVELYDQVLTAVATTSADRRFHTVVEAVLKHALSLLSCDTGGLKLRVLQFLAPATEDAVICLYVRMASGTAPWTPNGPCLELHGAESLAGYVVNKRVAVVCQDAATNP